MEYNISASATAPELYPADSVYILLSEGDNVLEVSKAYPYNGGWGNNISDCIYVTNGCHLPSVLEIAYLSIIEQEFYGLETKLDTLDSEIKNEPWKTVCERQQNIHIIIGMAPFGGVAVWLSIPQKQIILKWVRANIVHIDLEDYVPFKSDISLTEICNDYIDNDMEVARNLAEKGLPPRDLFDNYMKQFTYRYVAMFGKWKNKSERWEEYGEKEQLPELGWIEEALFDGTHDKLRDGGLMKYHEAGKPKRLAVSWHIGKAEYSAYFWFEDEGIREVFDRLYGAHPDTKTDFIIRIDAERRKYELALYRYGLKAPQVIPEDVYQLLVFKNKFEDYRSDNYNQERGAWIW